MRTGTRSSKVSRSSHPVKNQVHRRSDCTVLEQVHHLDLKLGSSTSDMESIRYSAFFTSGNEPKKLHLYTFIYLFFVQCKTKNTRSKTRQGQYKRERQIDGPRTLTYTSSRP